MRVSPVWFTLPHVRLTDLQGEPLPHLFYDPPANFNMAAGHVSFLPIALAGEERAFELDPVSGQRFFSHYQCDQQDIWNERGSVSGKPLYTVGVVPRHFDQLNLPQRIVVFGGSDYHMDEPVLYRARIVGAFVEQTCGEGRCLGPKDWVGRLVLLGVHEADPKYGKLKDIAGLQEAINWAKVKGQLENLPGYNASPERPYAAIKIGNILKAKDALAFMQQRAISLTSKELATTQESCVRLYDKFWEKAGKPTELDRPAKSAEEVKRMALLVQELKKANQPAYFGQRLGTMLEKYGEELATCSRLVYPGDPNGAPERYNFLSWVTFYARLHKEGWSYDCNAKSWSPDNKGALAMSEMKKWAVTCSARDYDLAMEGIPALLKALRTRGQRWRYIGWDEHSHGTHAKIHGWVKLPERVLACPGDINGKIRLSWQVEPEAGAWQRRHVEKSLKEADYIY